MKDKVTVYIITHNRIDLLKRCLDSVRMQTYANLDIIVVNDNSSDGTSDFLEKVMLQDERVRVFHNKENSGACFSRNVALTHAFGEYITGVDDDDYFLESRIDDFINNKNLLDEYAILYTDSIWKTKSGLRKAFINPFIKKTISFNDLLYFNFIGNQVFCKTSTLSEYGFDIRMPAWQDLDAWMRILKSNTNKAKKIKAYNYVQDISHEHERISASKIDKIRVAFELIEKKYSLDLREQGILESQLIPYGYKKVNALLLCFRFLYGMKLTGVLLYIRLLKNLLSNK